MHLYRVGVLLSETFPSLKFSALFLLSVNAWRQSINQFCFTLLYIIAHAMSLVHMHLKIPNIYSLNDNDNANSEKRNKNYFLYKIITKRKKQKERWRWRKKLTKPNNKQKIYLFYISKIKHALCIIISIKKEAK